MANTVLLEARPFRPFKSSEEYLYAMKEDLAEWFHTLYPELAINVDNFMDRIDTGVALCKHANNVKLAAIEYVARRQARALTRSMTCSTISATATSSSVVANTPDVRYLALAKPGTFFARDNVSNFIDWCRNSLRIFECLLFETDDLILRKNEKHVILCLLEVARKGAKFGMLAPMLVQMERQIDREIAQEQRAGGGEAICDSDSESEEMEPPVIMVYGPQPQIVTNDLKSLDEMVRDLVERCTCPTQFPMIRVSEGKYRIGDTKVLIFVRILRSHVMVRVGGGWDTLSHYLDKHDPCRCRSQHRSALTSRLINRPGAPDLNGAQVYYERRSSVSSICSNSGQTPQVNHLLTPTVSSRNRSRSPTPSRKLSSQLLANESRTRRSASPNPIRKSPNTQRKNLNVPGSNRLRSRSPTPSLFANDKHVASIKIQPDHATHISEASIQILDNAPATTTTPEENGSDNGSEISDEGYRSLGLIQNPAAETTKICNKINRLSLNSQNSLEDADFGERSSQNNSDSGSNNGDSKTIEEDTQASNVNTNNGDIYNETGLRKTYFSDAYFNDKKPDTTVIAKPRARSIEHSTSRSRSSSKEKSDSCDSPIKRQSMTYRSVRERKPPVQHTSPIKSSMSPSRSNIAVLSKKSPGMNLRESGNNTWSGRQSKQRASLTADTFTPPPKAMTPPVSFSRNSVGRTSLSASRSNGVAYDNNGRRIIKNTSSANTSPTKQKSPLLEQIMKTAEESRNDAQMLEKIKDVLKHYSHLVNSEDQGIDFTSAWVQSQGGNETKRCSVASDGAGSLSSAESSSTKNGTTGLPYVSPRKDVKAVGQVSKIPAPVSYKRSTTDLY